MTVKHTTLEGVVRPDDRSESNIKTNFGAEISIVWLNVMTTAAMESLIQYHRDRQTDFSDIPDLELLEWGWRQSIREELCRIHIETFYSHDDKWRQSALERALEGLVVVK
jgi:hypothetical protein